MTLRFRECNVEIIDALLVNKSISNTVTLGLVSFKGYCSTICQVVPATGRQKVPVVVFVLLLVGRVLGGLEESLLLSFEPRSRVRPTPRPTPRVMAMVRRMEVRMRQKRLLRPKSCFGPFSIGLYFMRCGVVGG